jgi:diguanylate cyclase (GGDEF)-like protein
MKRDNGKKPAILIVDDEPANLRLLATMLTEHQYSIRTVINGRMALGSIAMEKPDLILLDINMPEMNGYEVCQRLKTDEHAQDIPIIFISALSETLDKVKAFTVGGVDYITKPFQIEEVLARVENQLTIKRTREALQQANDKLACSIAEVQQHHQEMTLLQQMSHSLQRCVSKQELYPVFATYAARLFHQQSGALYLQQGKENGSLEVVAHWGNLPLQQQETALEKSSSMKHGEISLPWPQPNAQHPQRATMQTVAYASIPLSVHGARFGILRVFGGPTHHQEAYEHWLGLLLMVSEHLSLVFANLQLREQLHEQSIRDPLTGLFNRRYLDETLTREIDRAIRYQHSIGVIMADVDHFKHFNDTYGHDAGDALLRAVGSLFRTRIRSEDIACRYGGEEFVLILLEAGLQETARRADMLRESLSQTRIMHNDRFLGPITVSFGVAGVPDCGVSVETVIKAADDALYRSKQEGRNRVNIAECNEPPARTR